MTSINWTNCAYGWVVRVVKRPPDLTHPVMTRFADVYIPGVWTRLGGRLEKERIKKFIVEFAAIRHPIREFDTEEEAKLYVESVFALEYN